MRTLKGFCQVLPAAFVLAQIAGADVQAARTVADQPTKIQMGPQEYVSPDKAFRLSIPAGYSVQTGRTKESRSYIPVCHYESTVCVTFPTDRYKGTNFQGASFEVKQLDGKAASVCVSGEARFVYPPPSGATSEDFQIDTNIPRRTIHGMSFSHASVGAAAMSHDVQIDSYRAFTHGKCYELSIYVTFGNYAVYAPVVRKEFTNRDETHVTAELTKILDSFRILN